MASSLKSWLRDGVCLLACLLLPGWQTIAEAQFQPGQQHVYPFYYPEEESRLNIIPINYNVALRGQNDTEKVYNFSRDWLGLSKNGAATLAGATLFASRTDPNFNDGETCGIAGWACQGQRYQNLIDFANEHGFGINDLRTQLFFLGFELNDLFVLENSSLEGGYLPEAWGLLDELHGAADDEKEFLVALLENLNSPDEVPDNAHDDIDDIYTAYNSNEVINQDQTSITELFLSIPPDGNCDRFGQGSSNPAALTGSSMATIPIYGLYNSSGSQRTIPIHPCLAERTEALFHDLNRAMEQLGESKLWGGSYRSHTRQKELRISHCKQHNPGLTNHQIYDTSGLKCTPATAPAGRSRHEAGMAIDFRVANAGGTISNSNPTLYSTGPGRSAFLWLQQNAEQYGFENFEEENWHWSVDGY